MLVGWWIAECREVLVRWTSRVEKGSGHHGAACGPLAAATGLAMAVGLVGTWWWWWWGRWG